MRKSPHPPFTLHLQATRNSLEDGLRKVEDYCSAITTGQETASRLLVVIEELSTNTIKYGYREECIEPIQLTLRTATVGEEDGVFLVYEDRAAPFNPLKWECGSTLDKPPQQRLVGKTGIALIKGLVQSANYTWIEGANRLTLSFSRQD